MKKLMEFCMTTAAQVAYSTALNYNSRKKNTLHQAKVCVILNSSFMSLNGKIKLCSININTEANYTIKCYRSPLPLIFGLTEVRNDMVIHVLQLSIICGLRSGQEAFQIIPKNRNHSQSPRISKGGSSSVGNFNSATK